MSHSSRYLNIMFISVGFHLFTFAVPRILVKFPTRERPEQFFRCLDLYYSTISNNIPFHFLITCDEDDASMNNHNIRQRFAQYKNLQVIFGRSYSKIHACNRDMEQAPEFEILLLASDDMIPTTYEWDKIIVEHMMANFPDFDGVLKYDDRPDVRVMLNTFPIIGVNFYRLLGYIYHPSYKSLFCDLEMTYVSKLLEKEAVFNLMLFKHAHPDYGDTQMDPLYIKNFKYYWDDRGLFVQRAKELFKLNVTPHQNVMNMLQKTLDSLK